MPDQRDHLARLDLKIDAFENVAVTAGITEIEMTDADAAFHTIDVDRAGVLFGGIIEQAEHILCGNDTGRSFDA